MKKIQLITLFVISATAFIVLSSSSGGRATGNDSGNTGAPGEASTTCVTCHGGGGTNVETIVTLFDENEEVVSEYIPGSIYALEVKIDFVSGNQPVAHGFQALALADDSGDNIQTFANPDGNTTIHTTTANRQYAEHNGPNANTNFFRVEWTAPDVGTGPVTFYAGGNGVNLNGSNGGDGADLGQVTISEGEGVATIDLSKNGVAVYPTIARNFVTISSEHTQALSLKMIGMDGKVHMQENIVGTTTLDVSATEGGMYYMVFSNQDGELLGSTEFIKR